MTENEQRLFNERAARLEAYRQRVAALESELAEARQWKEKWETCEKWRKAYQEAKGELFAMGGEIAEAAIQHLPCNEATVDRWFRAEYIHKTAFDSVNTELGEARKDGERLDAIANGGLSIQYRDSAPASIRKWTVTFSATPIAGGDTLREAIDNFRGTR